MMGKINNFYSSLSHHVLFNFGIFTEYLQKFVPFPRLARLRRGLRMREVRSEEIVRDIDRFNGGGPHPLLKGLRDPSGLV